MKVDIKVKRSKKPILSKNMFKKLRKVFKNEVKGTIKNDIIESIQRGVSPVSQRNARIKNTGGKARYDKYSESYTDAINKGYVDNKKVRPVNLTLTGKMLRSIKVQFTNRGVKVWFTSPLAKYHNDMGAGKSKTIRRMLPKTGEKFNVGIQRKIANAVKKAIKSVKRKR